MRVLLIDSDKTVVDSIEMMLNIEGMSVQRTANGEDGVEFGRSYEYDIIILDIVLPDISGLEVLRSLRGSKVKTPVLILSGRDGVEDVVNSLASGADDFVSKPFHKDNLIARIRAVVRRSNGHAVSTIEFGDLVINIDEASVYVGSNKVRLSNKQFQFLRVLAINKNKVVTKEKIFDSLYGGGNLEEPTFKIIDVFLCKLRERLAAASGGKDFIETIWGRGYIMRESVEAGR